MNGLQGCLKLESAQNVNLPIGTEKRCTRCGIVKSLNKFYIYPKGRRKGRLHAGCKECQKKSRGIWRSNNKDKSKIAHNRWLSKPGKKDLKRKIILKARVKRREQWMQILKERDLTKCSICGYNKFFYVIDFHHTEPKQKEYNISSLIQRIPTENRIKELDKCIPLCANCHREVHGGNNKIPPLNSLESIHANQIGWT